MIQLGENWLEEDMELPEGLKRFLRDAHIRE